MVAASEAVRWLRHRDNFPPFFFPFPLIFWRAAASCDSDSDSGRFFVGLDTRHSWAESASGVFLRVSEGGGDCVYVSGGLISVER